MEAHLAPTQPTQMNKITTLCEICCGPHDTQYCMENPKQAFIKYASSRTDKAGEDLTLYDNKSWNGLRDFAKPVKAISLPQDIPSTSDRSLIELENQVQRLMEAHFVPKQPFQVNKITSSCEIYSGPQDTEYCMENPEQAFVEYASSRTDEAGGKWYTFKPEQNNLGDTYNSS
nr:MAK10-like protein [Tanacetum cinerariifolium]